MIADDVIVVGGGAVALSFALLMRRQNRRVRLLSLPGGGGGGGRHYALSGRRLTLLKKLSVSPPTHDVRRFSLSAGARRLALTGSPLCHIVREEDLLRALGAQTAAMTTTCRDISDVRLAESGVSLKADGKTYAASLLAVADGARSPLAAQLGVFTASFDFQQQAATTRVASSSLSSDTAYQWFDDNDTVALLPLGGGDFSLIWSAVSPPSLASLLQQLAVRTGVGDLKRCADAPLHFFPLRASRRATRVAVRTAFLGDAARVIHPLAGQGLNLGLADADCLALCLRRRRDAGASEALAAYAAARRCPADMLHSLTTALSRSKRAAAAALVAGHFPGVAAVAVRFANA